MFFLVTVCLSGLQCVVVTLHLLLVPQNLPNIPYFPHRLHFHNSRAQLDLQRRVHLSWYCQWRCIGPLLNKYFLNSLYNSCFRSNRLDNRLTRGIKTLPKAQRTRRLSSAYQINFFRSYHKFLHKSWSNIFRISTKHQVQSLNQISAFRQNVNLKILTKPSFKILPKIELHNHNQASYQ